MSSRRRGRGLARRETRNTARRRAMTLDEPGDGGTPESENGEFDYVDVVVEREPRDNLTFHPWYAMRPGSVARAAIALTFAPTRARDPDFLDAVQRGAVERIDAAIANELPT